LARISEAFLHGLVFYPTDTVYGIGCSAYSEHLVLRVGESKGRPVGKPLSVIAPSLEWIHEYCIVSGGAQGWLQKLPCPYTLIFKRRKDGKLAQSLNLVDPEVVGVRIPDHWIREAIALAGVPIVTTSVNMHGEGPPATTLEDIPKSMIPYLDLAIQAGTLSGHPSTIVDLRNEEPVTRARL